MAKKRTRSSVLADNRRARHDYHILDTYEAGIELKGTEVKSLREGKATLAEAYVNIRNLEAYIVNWYIHPYEQGNRFNPDPLRDRKLLLHKREIIRLGQRIMEEGLTLIPLKLYRKRGLLKLEIAVARGKKQYDKRRAIEDRDVQRQMDRQMKDFNRHYSS